jgi:hypothetical protein
MSNETIYEGEIPNLKEIADKTESHRVKKIKKFYDAFFDSFFKSAGDLAIKPKAPRYLQITIESKDIKSAPLAEHHKRLNKRYFDLLIKKSNNEYKIIIDTPKGHGTEIPAAYIKAEW